MLQSAGSSYSAALVARPVLTKSLTAGLPFFLSDYCAQSIEKPSSEEVEDEGTKKKKKNVPAAPVSTWERNAKFYCFLWLCDVCSRIPNNSLFEGEGYFL